MKKTIYSLKHEDGYLSRLIVLVFIFLMTFYPCLKVSAQEENEEKADTAALRKLVRKLQNSNIPRTWEPLNPLTSNSNCSNSDFSLGNFTNWSGCYGNWCADTLRTETRCSGLFIPFKDPCSNLGMPWYNNPTGGHFSIQNPGTDPCISGLQKVFPGDAHSALIGNRSCSSGGGGYVDQLTYSITYDPNNSFFIYRCAVVLENPNSIPPHNSVNRRPRFTFSIKDHNTGILLDSVCGFYDLYPEDGITVWQNGPGDFLWKNWSTIGLDLNVLSGLTPGQLLDIVFNVHGCGFTAHTGYAYISAYCGAMTITNTGCNGTGSITMTGPAGFVTYQWQGPYCPTCAPNPPIYLGNPVTITAAQGAVTGNTFTLTLTALNGCQVQNIVQVIAFTTIHAGFTQAMGCAQRPSQFTDTSKVSQNSVTAWRWFFGDLPSGAADSSHLQNPTHSFTSPGNYTVKLIAYSTEGCPDTTTKLVTVDTLVTITNTSTREQICNGQHTDINLTTNLSNSLFTWTATASSVNISGYSGNANPGPGVIDQTLLNSGNQLDSVTYIITPHEGSCNGDPFTYRVVVFPVPSVSFNPATPSICANQTTNILLTPSVVNTSFTWTATSDSLDVTGYGPGSGSVIAQTLNQPGFSTEYVTYHVVPLANSCPGDTANVTVLVNPRPHLETNPMNQTICSQTQTNINLIASCAGTSYTWTGALAVGNVSGFSSGSGTPIKQTLIDNLTTQGQVNYTIHTTAGGCIGNDTSFIVTVNPLPVPSISGTNVLCAGSTVVIYTAQAGMTSYSWLVSAGGTITAGGSSSDNSVTVIWNTAGSQTVSLNYTDGNGCTALAPTVYPVTINALPNPIITGSANLCNGSTGNVYSSTAGMTNYQWIVSAGGTITAGGTATDNSVTVTWNTPGAKTISLNYHDLNGCTAVSPTVYNVTVNPLPNPTITGFVSVCLNSNSSYTTEAGMTNYTWTVSPGGTITSGSGTNVATINWTSPGAKIITVNYFNGFNCTAQSATPYNVTVNPLPSPSLTGTTGICKGFSATYTTDAGMNNYSWLVSAGGTVTSGGGTNNNTVTVLWMASGAQTVSINYFDLNGCTATAPMVLPVTVNPLPIPAIAGAAVLCAGTIGVIYTTQPGNTAYQWAISAGGTITSGGTVTDNTVTVTWNTPGAQTVSVNYHDPNGCTALASTVYPVTVNPLPTPTISGSVSVCLNSNSSYTTEAGMTNYTWTVSPGGTITSGSGTNVATINWTSPGAKIITVNYFNGFNCTAQSATPYNVTVNPLPSPSLTGTTGICKGFSATYTTDAGMNNYSWLVSAGGTVTSGGGTNNNTVTVLWMASGAQTVSINYFDLNGCTATAPMVLPVTVNPLPIPAIAGAAVLCAGTIGVIYTTQPGNTAYQWAISAGGTITSGGTVTDNTVTVTWNTPGAQTVSVNYHDPNGCTALASTVYPVTVNPLPTPTISGSVSVCLNSNSSYTTEAGMTNYTWTVSPGGTITSGSGTNVATINWTSPGAKIITVNYFNGFNCTAQSATPYNVTVNPLPSPSLTGTTGICKGFSATYTTDAGMNNYSWLVSAGGTVTSGGGTNNNTVTVLWMASGAQTVSINYFDLNGCTATAPMVLPVTVNPLPIPAIAGAAVLCAGTIGVIYTTQPGNTAYQWAISAGGTITSGGTATDNTVTVTWNTPGAQTVSVNFHDPNGCTALASTIYPVTINPLPVPVISGPAAICLNYSGTYTTAAGMSNYAWTVTTGGTITGGNGTDAVTINWTSTGLKTITVNYIDGNGCTASTASSYNVTVNTLPSPSLNGINSICVGFSATYTTDIGMNNYSWTVSAGGTVTAGGGTNDNTVTVTWTAAGAQTVSVNYVVGTGCTAISPTVYNVAVHALPAPTISGTPTLCAGSAGIIYGTQAGMNNYQWSVSAGGTITAGGTNLDNTVTVTWNTPGAQTVTVNYHDANGCTALSSTIYPVTVNPLPIPSISGASSVCLNSSSTYFTEAGMVNYIWTVSAGGSITSGTGTNSIIVLWNTVGVKTIQVNYNDANGCTAAVPTSYPVTVNTLPVPSLTGLNAICSALSAVYTTDAGMNTYSWLVSAGGSIIAGGGTSDNTATILWNTAGAQTVSVNYLMGTGCTAPAPTVLNVTVKPRPAITNAANSTLCSSGTTNIVFTSSLFGTTYTWTAGSSGNVSGFSNGAGGSIIQTLVNTGFSIETVNYAVTPSLNGCDGPIAHYIVTVNPVADVYFNPNGQSFCSGGTTSINILSHVTGTTFTWTATGSSGNVSGFGPGSGNLIAQTLNNSGPYFENVNYDVFPLANSCAGTDNHVIVNMNPTPQVSFTTCNDIITTTDAKPITLKGGIPLGGVYSGPGVNTGIFYPSLAGPGNFSINYSYSNTWGCNANMSKTISVISAIPFFCDNLLNDIRDNQQYPTVKLGTQCWMSKNLNYGNIVPSTSMQRDNCISEKYCFNDDVANCATYGGLYQWDELMQYDNTAADQGFCPPAWHIPTNNDWNTLFGFYISNGFAGSPLKYTGYSGFNAFLSGTRFNNVNWNFTNFAVMFWTSTTDGTRKAWAHGMNIYNPSVSNYPSSRTHAFNVRCIKD